MSKSKKNTFLSQMAGSVEGASLLSKGAFRSEPSGFIPTGIEEVDKYVLGCGGLPLGRISEVYGAPGAGKSSFVYSCIKQCQLMGGIPVLIHTEEAAQKERLVTTFGVEAGNMLLVEPEHMEGVVAAVEKALAPILKSRAKDRPPVLLCWDSLAATRVQGHDNAQLTKKTKAAKKGEVGSKEAPAERARLLNSALRVLPTMIAKAQGHFMIVNQNRTKVGVMFGSDKTQPGGNAPKYHTTIRLELTYTGKIGPKGHPTGITTKFQATKNKMAPPYRHHEVQLDFDAGWTDKGVLTLAKSLGLVSAKATSVAAARVALDAVKWNPNAPVAEEDLGPAIPEGEEWDDGEEVEDGE